MHLCICIYIIYWNLYTCKHTHTHTYTTREREKAIKYYTTHHAIFYTYNIIIWSILFFGSRRTNGNNTSTHTHLYIKYDIRILYIVCIRTNILKIWIIVEYCSTHLSQGAQTHMCLCACVRVSVFIRWSCKRFIFIDLYKLTAWHGMVWYVMLWCVQLIIYVPAPNAELTICWFNLIYAHSYWMCWDWKYVKQIELMQKHIQCLTTKITNVFSIREREREKKRRRQKTTHEHIIRTNVLVKWFGKVDDEQGLGDEKQEINKTNGKYMSHHLVLFSMFLRQFSFE